MKPDFLVIGAQKCATTWLHFHLRQHPQIFMPAEKDVELFSYTVNLKPEIYQAWLDRFDGHDEKTRLGDANAAYFWTETGSAWHSKPVGFNEHIPQSVQTLMGDDVQFIVSLRDPVDRAVSAYLHHIAHGAITPEQSLADAAARFGIVDMGFFGAHLQNWLRVYPPRQFLVIRTLPCDQITSEHILSGCLGFLGLESFPLGQDVAKPVYAGIPRLMNPDGVWVAEQHPSIIAHLPLSRQVPRQVIEGVTYFCLIDSNELQKLENIFAKDQDLLLNLLAQQSGADGLSVVDPDLPGEFRAEV